MPSPCVYTHACERLCTHVKDPIVHVTEFGGLWKHKNNQHALLPPKTECGCPSGGGIQNGHIRRNAENKKIKQCCSQQLHGHAAEPAGVGGAALCGDSAALRFHAGLLQPPLQQALPDGLLHPRAQGTSVWLSLFVRGGRRGDEGQGR